MTALTKRIENEEQYDKALAFLVSTAQELENPLLDGPERAKKQALYDHVDNLIEEYKNRRRDLIREYPGLRTAYQKLGWAYNDPEEQEPSKEPETAPSPDQEPMPEPDPEPPAESPEPSFWDMLDDE